MMAYEFEYMSRNRFGMNTNGKIVLGFLLGATIGTVTALLLAPTTGLRTRKNVNRKAKKLVKQLKSLVAKKKTVKGRKSTSTASRKNGRTMITVA